MVLTVLLIALGLFGFAVYLVYTYAGADGLSRFKNDLRHWAMTIVGIAISLYVFSSAYVYILKNHMFHNYYECEPINADIEKYNVKANFHVHDEVMRVYRSDTTGYEEYTLEKEDIKWENLVITGERVYSKMLPPDEVTTYTYPSPRSSLSKKFIWRNGRQIVNPYYSEPKTYTIDRKYMNIFYQPNLFWWDIERDNIWINPSESFALLNTLSWDCDWKVRIFPRQVSTP